jgi:hypothetical protein
MAKDCAPAEGATAAQVSATSSNVRYGMQTVGIILALLLQVPLDAQPPDRGAAGEDPVHRSTEGAKVVIDLSATVAGEAWDRNQSLEWVSGAMGGIQRQVWRALAIRAEVMLLRIAQQGNDAWLRGITVGTRARWGSGPLRPLLDVAVGVSDATAETPPGGTPFNYLAVIGAGVEKPLRDWLVHVTGRWLHASNNGREGRARNPDIQSLGVVFGVGWEY